MQKAKITAEEFDRKFDADEDVSEFVDFESATKKVNVDFPAWMVAALDAEAGRLGIPRQALIKIYLDNQLQQAKAGRLITA